MIAAVLLIVSVQSAPPSPLGESAPASIDFSRDVKPILSDRCFQCHGPDSENAESDLRLDSFEAATEDFGGYAAILPGDAGASELYSRITHGRPGLKMPPPESNLALTKDEIETLRRWIEEGAAYDRHWSFEPVPLRDPDRRVDDILFDAISARGIEPAAPADSATLLRRVSIDLTGLPPTTAELASFLQDPSGDAYERAVERLLTSPHHAEQLASSWLDVARYADTFGYQADKDMHVWRWRDWVLEAFAANMPYDEFATHQLAGDLIEGATRASRLATTFNRLHRQTNEGGSVEEEFRVESVSDRVETMSSAFLGLTVGCAKCHDHKFDPISQRDYFGLFALFDDIDESGLYSHFTNAVPTPALDLPSETQDVELKKLDRRIAALEALGVPSPRAGASSYFTDFDDLRGAGNGLPEEEKAKRTLLGTPEVVARAGGHAIRLSGENAVEFPGVGVFHRFDAFSIALNLKVPEAFDRAVVIHRTKSWTDSGSRGYQVLIEDGRVTVALVHFWPGDAAAIRSAAQLPVDQWTHIAFTYDGSSSAAGLRLYLDGLPAESEVIRDRLTRTIRGGSIGHLNIGSRFRDRGLKGGEVDDVLVAGWELTADEIALAASGAIPPAPADGDPASAELFELRKERDQLSDRVPQIMTMRESPDLPAARRTAYLLRRGEYSSRGEEVPPALPAALPALLGQPAENRLDLARWLTHPEHPLTARVHADRLWRFVFGKSLVATPEDFGSQCPPPVHLALLDHLARELVDTGWDTRAMIRRLVLSRAYRMSSVPTASARALDPANELFARAVTKRLSAEEIRDGALLAAGLLDLTAGGQSVFPYQPPGLWQEKRGNVYPVGRGQSLVRRSLYTYWRRTSPPPTMGMFDAPSREACVVSRPSTSTPLQALALWNDPQFVASAVALGMRAAALPDGTDTGAVEHLFLSLASRAPTEAEAAAMLGLFTEQHAAFLESPADAWALSHYDLERAAHGEPFPEMETRVENDARIAALAVVASAMLGLDDVVTRR